MPKQIHFLPFYGFICDNLAFPSVKSSKFSQDIAYSGIQIFNMKKVGFVEAGFSIFAAYCSSDLGRQFTNCCLLKFFNSINTMRT